MKAITMRRLAFAALLVPSLAHAHHFMGGGLVQTFTQGLLSGLGHPIIEVDHAAFILAVGFLAALVNRGAWAVVALIAGSLVGAALHLAGVGLPGLEIWIALSVVFAGLLVLWHRRIPLAWLSLGFAVAGALHGYAYAETIFGAEPAPLGAYLLGFSLIQLAVALAAFWMHRQLIARRTPAFALGLGGVVSLLGTALLALSLGS